MDFTVPVDHSVKMQENKKIEKYWDLARKQKKTVEKEGYTSCGWCTWNSL